MDRLTWDDLMKVDWRAALKEESAKTDGPNLYQPGAVLQKAIDEIHSSFKSAAPAPSPPVDEALARLVHHPAIILIVGHRGSGKSALAVRLQELKRDVAPAYALGLPAKATRLLPDWYGLTDDPLAIPPNAIIYIPESYRLFHARGTQTKQGKAISDLVNLSRHRRHTLIFDVQNPAHLDRNIISEADIVLVKEPGPFQRGFERAQFRGIMDTARGTFAVVGQSRKKRCVWVVAPGAGIAGQLMENLLPTFWTESLSHVFADTTPALGSLGENRAKPSTGKRTDQTKTATPRRGRPSTTGDKRARALQMHSAGHTFGEIAETLGISRSYAHQLVKGKPSKGH